MFYQLDGIQHFFSQTKWWGLFWWVDWADWSGGLGILGFKKLFGAFHARCRLGDFLISLKFVHVDIHPPPKKKKNILYDERRDFVKKKTSCGKYLKLKFGGCSRCSLAVINLACLQIFGSAERLQNRKLSVNVKLFYWYLGVFKNSGTPFVTVD